jgi:HAMP domain-containing protein
MLVLIVSVGILLALVVTLTVMDRRERRTRELIALAESGMLDARRHNDATGQR